MSVVLLQYVILDEQTRGRDERSEEPDVDCGVNETWKFIKNNWGLPDLIVSLADDTRAFFTNQRLLKSILFDLVKSVDALGKHPA